MLALARSATLSGIEAAPVLVEAVQLFAPADEVAPAPPSWEAALEDLLVLLRERGVRRLYCDRWPATAIRRETGGALAVPLHPAHFSTDPARLPLALRLNVHSALLARAEDAPRCRENLFRAGWSLRETTVGPWVLFDFGGDAPWKPGLGREGRLQWAGFACLPAAP